MRLVKKIFLRFCLVLFGFFIAIVFAEGFVRIFYPSSRGHVVPVGLFEMDNYLGWKLVAENDVTHHSRYFEVSYQTNAFGYRDKPRNLSKDKNINRILLYGDSQIFGWGVEADRRFSNAIEAKKLNLEVWNLAVPGYGLDQEVLSYEKYGQHLDADEVILNP